jgi:hypothetical protein
MQNMKKSLLYLFGFGMSIIMSSCALTTQVHFNKNFSGTYSQNIELGGMMDMAKEFGAVDSDSDAGSMIDEVLSPEDRVNLIEDVNKVDGISNASFDLSDKSNLKFAFDFKDIESLNKAFSKFQLSLAEQNEMMEQAMNEMGGTESTGLPEFSKRGKTIAYGASFPNEKLPEDALEELEAMGGTEEMMQMAMEMIDYTFDFTFDRKIKSVNLVGMELISQEKNRVRARVDLAKLIEGEPYKIEVTTK